jgi:pimeloyl-ACP methyl ester carboxylesterase
MPFAPINGVDLHYVEQGHGTPVVLVHGFPLDSRIFARQIDSLSGKFRVVAPDLRGFGQSRSVEPFTIPSLADDVHRLLRHLGALPCVLAGLSMGGYVSLAFADKYAADLKGLILIDTKSEADTDEAKQNRLKMADLARTQGSGPVAEQMFPKMLAPETPKRLPHVAATLRTIMQQCPAKTIEHACLAMKDRADYTPLLTRLDVPGLIVVGANDAIAPPKIAQQMQQNLKKAGLALIPNAGHIPTMEQPDDVSGAIRSFVESVR